MHLIVDGHAKNKALMTDRGLMKEWLRGTVELAGMTPFGEPFIYGFPWPGSEDWTALTGYQPLMESGLSVHCWPEKEFVFIDLFSCGDFNERTVISHIEKTFQMSNPRVMLLARGINPKTGELIPARFLTGIVGDAP